MLTLTVSTKCKFTLKQAGTVKYHPKAIKLMKLKSTPGKDEHQPKHRCLRSTDNTQKSTADDTGNKISFILRLLVP